MEKLVIGLTGRFGAGCTTTSLYFEQDLKFKRFSLSDELKKIAKKKTPRWPSLTANQQRKILQDLGDTLRSKNSTYLADNVIKKIEKQNGSKIIVDSLRNPSEIKAFQKKFQSFFLLAIDAEVTTRWDRLKENYNNDRASFDIADKRDAGYDQPNYGQQVKKCLEMGDILINNDISFYKDITTKRLDPEMVDRYAQKLNDYYNLLSSAGSRTPNLDEINMHYACSVALKSHCVKRQVGAVIVKEQGLNLSNKRESYVVATGCNNVPLGETDCAIENRLDELKCYRDQVKRDFFKKYKYCKYCGTKLNNQFICKKCKHDNRNLPGKQLDLCRAVHAEEAAILQAVKLGATSLEGAKLYSSTFPCMLCCKKIINAGIRSIVYLESYPMDESLAIEMFRNCKIGIQKYEGVNSRAFDRLFRRSV
jgi:deoxycytidylate deaminase